MTKKPERTGRMKSRKAVTKTASAPLRPSTSLAAAGEFDEVLALIEAARQRAYQAVNTELVGLYWQLGAYISDKIESAQWGDGVVDDLAAAICRQYPGMRGYTRSNLFRMRQFYETYRSSEKVAPLVRQLPWTHHLIILGRTKYPEEREFYMLSAIQGRWTKRELERQIRSGAALRAAPVRKKASPALAQIHPAAAVEFKNEYSLEFLGLPGDHSEADLHGALLRNLGSFITELGRDFCFVGSEYPVQVGKQDFAIDLLFFHRGLACLVAFELKVREFRPEDLGKLSFYVEALDRDVRKEHERPSIGVLLCATKDNEVVEYALAGTTSPTLVTEYQTVLPSKDLLRRKLHELYARLALAERTEPALRAISAKPEAAPKTKAAPKKAKGKQ
ncbi:MAG: PDDEXK nuclease domain-containing protein [Armatimonadetes bacterium]|nr:PDDEXK nuclease domain-containing protein [Armatimonadota bacterium]